MNPDGIKRLLATNDRAVERAMVVLYDRQTQDEKQTSDTRHTNRRGFSCAHASKGSYYARWVLSGRRLTGRHLDNARKIACHYTAQLVEVSENRRVAEAVIRTAGNRRLESVEDCERYMQELEARGDREQTIREEEAKERWKAALEDH